MNRDSHTTVLSTYQVRQGLHVAQKQLLESHTPSLFKFTYYLRVGCSAMQKVGLKQIDEKGRYQNLYQSFYHNFYYAELFKSLTAYDSQWWLKCYVNEAGLLQSDDPAIHRLLEPIKEVYRITESVSTASLETIDNRNVTRGSAR
jgi:hypothetical protein